jgi:hypothetical protein
VRRLLIGLFFRAARAFFSSIKAGVSLVYSKDTIATSSFIGFTGLSHSLECFTNALKGDRLAVKLVI